MISAVAHFALLLGATAAVFLSGTALQGSLGAALVVAGLAMVCCRPPVRIDGKLCAVAAGLVLAASLALLPQSWWPAPSWRQPLLSAGVALPSTITPMIRETLFWLGVFAIAVAVGLFALAHPLRSKTQLALAITAVGICALYADLARYAQQTGWEFPFDYNPEVFGFFKNINHTSSFLVTGSVLSLGILGVAFRQRHWLAGALAAAALVICATSIFFHTSSRAGILSLLFGTLLWFVGVGAGRWSKPMVISFAAVFMASLLLFFAAQSKARGRLLALFGFRDVPAATLRLATTPAPSAPVAGRLDMRDLRALIFADTLRIVRDFPLTGAGLGTFPYLFPLYRDLSLNDAPSAHPESDWLMLAAEAGVPAVLLLGSGVGLLLWRVRARRTHAYWPLRWGFICAGLAALVHGLVDVPSHLLGWWILAICAAGFQMRPTEATKPSRAQHAVFVLTGVGALVLGVLLIRAQWFGGFHLPPLAPRMATAEVHILRDGGKLQEAVEAGRELIRRHPLAAYAYRALGLALLNLPGREAEATAILRIERLLSTDAPQIPLEQAQFWIDRDPRQTLALWREAMQMRERSDRSQRRGESGLLSLYAELVSRAAAHPELQRELLDFSAQRPEFVLVWLEKATPALVAPEIAHLASDPVFLEQLDEAKRRRLLRAWDEKGARDALLTFIAAQPAWQDAAWPVQVRRLAENRKFEDAVRMVAARYDISLTLPATDAKTTEVPSGDPESAVGAFLEAWRKGNTVAARRILEEARVAPTIPPEIWRLSAALAASEVDWPAGWQFLERFLSETGRAALP